MKNGDWRVARSPSTTWEGRKAYYLQVRERVFRLLGERCVRCDFADKRALQFDHVDGKGNVARRSKSGTSYFHYILNELKKPDGERFQVLCANCNWIKRAENNEQPAGRRLKE